MLAAEGNARSEICYADLEMLWNFRFGNVVEFPLEYLVVIVKSITYLSFRFLCGKYFACFKPHWKCLRWWWRQFYLNKSFLMTQCVKPSWPSGITVMLRQRSQNRLSSNKRFFSLSFSFFFCYYYFFYHSFYKNNCLSRKDESFFNNRGQNIVTAYDRDINKTNKTRHKDSTNEPRLKWNSKC